jgi:hypothetical protein
VNGNKGLIDGAAATSSWLDCRRYQSIAMAAAIP